MTKMAWLVAVSLVALSCGYPPLPAPRADASPELDDPVAQPPPSCNGLASPCGGGAHASCCESIVVPGGMFFRDFDDAGFNDRSNPATVSRFALDTYEVTVGRFRAFVEMGGGTKANPPSPGAGAHPHLPGSGWDSSWNASLADNTLVLKTSLDCHSVLHSWTNAPGTNENLPINCVTWYEAMAFCIWDGGYLPTEAEWDFAASGGTDQRAYPWSKPANSTVIDCSYANYEFDTSAGMSCTNGVQNVGDTSPKGDGRWGHVDLAGNVLEWTLDWFAATPPQPCSDCANLTPAPSRTTRGGSFIHGDFLQRTSSRYLRNDPTTRCSCTGLRCARDPGAAARPKA